MRRHSDPSLVSTTTELQKHQRRTKPIRKWLPAVSVLAVICLAGLGIIGYRAGLFHRTNRVNKAQETNTPSLQPHQSQRLP